jgi:hypothetical protein
VLELSGLALFHLSQVDENFRWLFLVSSPSTATLYHIDMSALNTVRHWIPHADGTGRNSGGGELREAGWAIVVASHPKRLIA